MVQLKSSFPIAKSKHLYMAYALFQFFWGELIFKSQQVDESNIVESSRRLDGISTMLLSSTPSCLGKGSPYKERGNNILQSCKCELLPLLLFNCTCCGSPLLVSPTHVHSILFSSQSWNSCTHRHSHV